ncbi:hypothetical protein SOVF_013390 [Spinacia oleracea]|uniref:Nucleolin 2 n=1 Tax=Spinacia oleracea TaxID=3562 RepID=A0A9R0I7E1_SPIOL|nr:nucleolin 2 [Spinacia oleracea]KNA24718.1 hypothetical protein SOVF_013390 [Spinacia oleracea]
MVVLPEFPKSFKLSRKSDFASKLKPLILHKLNQYGFDYSDGVLAEYITILVCNGKNQNHVRDGLQAFLGIRTEEFVSWLWKFLLKNETQFTAAVSSVRKDKISHSSRDIDRDKDDASRTFKNCKSQGNRGSASLMAEREETCCSLKQTCKSDDIEPSKNHHPPPAKEMTNSPIQSNVPQSKVPNFSSLIKVTSSVRKYEIERVDGFEKRSRYPDLFPRTTSLKEDLASELKYPPASVAKSSRCSKLADKKSAPVLGRPPASLPERSPASGTYFSNVSKLSVVPSSGINQSRQSVWDRLGKPPKDVPSRSQIADVCARDKAHCNKSWTDQNSALIPKPSAQMDQDSPLPALSIVQGRRRLKQGHQVVQGDGAQKNYDAMRPKNVDKTDAEIPSIINIGRKRQFGEINSNIDAGMVTMKRADNQFEKTCQSHKISEFPSEASHSVDPQVNEIKLRMRQIEIEMVKLRTKQTLMEADGKTNLLTNCGTMKPTEDKSRTVLVTNVHFEATKETLSLYFRKCGAVVDIKLADNVPSARDRSAYITFQNKEAADKALGFSGASFYSRSIKVCRNGEFPGPATASAGIAGKKMQITHSKSNIDPEGLSVSESHFKCQNEPLFSTHLEPMSSFCDQTKTVPGCQQEPSAASAEMAGESEQQNFATDTFASQKEPLTSF